MLGTGGTLGAVELGSLVIEPLVMLVMAVLILGWLLYTCNVVKDKYE